MFETFAHTADIGLRVSASNVNALFAEAGRGLFSIIVEDISAVVPAESIRIQLPGRDLEYLLVDWLSKLLELFETRRMVFSLFDVTVSADGLEAVAKGERVDACRHRLEHEVKAVTYHGLKVEQTGDAWRGEVVLDI